MAIRQGSPVARLSPPWRASAVALAALLAVASACGTGGGKRAGGAGGTAGEGGGGGGGGEDPVLRAEITPASLSLAERDEATLIAWVVDADDNRSVPLVVGWASSDPSVATVDEAGLVSAHGPGAATISATFEGMTAEAEVTVTPAVAAGVTIHGAPRSFFVGEALGLEAVVVDAAGRTLARTPTWTSSAPTVATVNTAGEVLAVETGTTTITAQVDGHQDQVTLVVSRLEPSFTLGSRFTCYLDGAGVAWCWGQNQGGQLGDGTKVDRPSPVRAAPGLTFRSLDAGTNHVCGVTFGERKVFCWGAGEAAPVLGASVTQSSTPVLVSDGPYEVVSSSFARGCVLDSQGHPYCWGHNLNYRLGNGSTEPSPVPVPVSPPAGGAPLDLVSIKSGGTHTCGTTADGRLFCWGDNYHGALGNGNRLNSPRPVEVFPGSTVEAYGVGRNSSCATKGGVPYCWGDPYKGQLGIGPTTEFSVNTPTPVLAGGKVFTDYAGGDWYMCARTQGGEVWCSGDNDFGQLGRTGGDSDVPVQVSGGIGFSSIASSFWNTCGISVGGVAYCWGENSFGQLGSGLTDAMRDTPTLVQR